MFKKSNKTQRSPENVGRAEGGDREDDKVEEGDRKNNKGIIGRKGMEG